MMVPVAVSAWTDYFCEWADPAYVAGTPDRHEVTLKGVIEPDSTAFDIAVSRDSFGTLVRMEPTYPQHFKDHESAKRKWLHAWAKIALRAGYRMPGIDPVAYGLLCSLKREASRIEFIFDTNVLISGVGHWLVRMFGARADLVRTVITDKEIQGFKDRWKGTPKNIDALLARMNFLSASRFLEQVPHKHPIWRSLDIDDEGALLLASGSSKDGKSPAADTLLLRAARRAVQDQVPGLRRLFVTEDAGLARTAAHMLPAGATIGAWVEPIRSDGEVIAPLHWWPGSGKFGAGVMTHLSHLICEALCLCTEVHVQREDGDTLVVSAYRPGCNEYPSLWQSPLLWVRHQTSHGGSRSARASERGGLGGSSKLPASSTDTDPASSWPLRSVDTSHRYETGARFNRTSFVDAVTAVMLAVRERQSHLRVPLAQDEASNRSFYRMLTAAGLVDDMTRRMTPLADTLPGIFASDDIDSLTAIFARLEPLAILLDKLRDASSFIPYPTKVAGLQGRKLRAYLSLARFLGQAVAVQNADGRELWYGGAAPDQDAFESWLIQVTREESEKDPLHEAPVKRIAQRALKEIHVSPSRLQRALTVVLQGALGAQLKGNQGGSEDRQFLAEEVLVLSPDSYQVVEVGGDGLCDLRSLSWRPS